MLEVICNHESNADCLCLMWWPRSFWEVKTKQNESKQVPHISFCLYKGLDNYANGDQVWLPRFWGKRTTDDQLWLFWNPAKKHLWYHTVMLYNAVYSNIFIRIRIEWWWRVSSTRPKLLAERILASFAVLSRTQHHNPSSSYSCPMRFLGDLTVYRLCIKSPM